MPATSLSASPSFQRVRTAIGALSVLVAASLGVMSYLHLSGTLGGGATDNVSAAGIAEAIIGVVLVAGAVAVLRAPFPAARRAGLGAAGFAIAGFLLGLSFTLRGGSAVDVAYHLSTLPVLVLIGVLLLRWQPRQVG